MKINGVLLSINYYFSLAGINLESTQNGLSPAYKPVMELTPETVSQLLELNSQMD